MMLKHFIPRYVGELIYNSNPPGVNLIVFETWCLYQPLKTTGSTKVQCSTGFPTKKTYLNMTLAIWLPAPSSAIPPASGFTRGIGLGVGGRACASCSRQLILCPRPSSAVSEASTLTLGAGRADWGRLESLVMSWLMFPPLWSSAVFCASGFTLHITEVSGMSIVRSGSEIHILQCLIEYSMLQISHIPREQNLISKVLLSQWR